MQFRFVEFPAFTQFVGTYLREDEYARLQQALLANPTPRASRAARLRAAANCAERIRGANRTQAGSRAKTPDSFWLQIVREMLGDDVVHPDQLRSCTVWPFPPPFPAFAFILSMSRSRGLVRLLGGKLDLSALQDHHPALGPFQAGTVDRDDLVRLADSIPALDRPLESERVGQVLGELALALHRLGSLSGRRAVERWLSEYPPGSAARTIADSDRRTRAMFAAEAAARAKMADLRPTIERYLTSSDSWVVGYTIHNLAQLGGAESVPGIARFLEDPDCHRAYAAAEALVTMGAKSRRAEIERGLGRCKEFIHLIPRLLARLDSGRSHAGRR